LKKVNDYFVWMFHGGNEISTQVITFKTKNDTNTNMKRVKRKGQR
jgi:hypothetical protein